ncbi:unnamed protein product [Oncorhynchus mykiss]|uniref:Neuroblast differentiation-associated protein AHNAK-like n=1 Tax=Oncorhynchus mykiss TaxID=8022 RepID=A0A060WQ98_ONCMY|nr:unnamed protein product [Oncorhynchus mykiss]
MYALVNFFEGTSEIVPVEHIEEFDGTCDNASHLFKWENLHNWCLTKYFFAPLYKKTTETFFKPSISSTVLGDEIVAATIHLNHLNKDDLMKILKIMEPYEDNMSFVTKPDLNASVSLSSLDSGLKSPGDMLKDTYSRMQRAVEAPSIEVNGLNGQLNAEGWLKNEINGPALNGVLPNVTLDTPGPDGGAKFPTIGMSGPVMKGADQEGTLTHPKVSLSTPEFSTPDASLDLEKPEVKTSGLMYKPPKFKMPHFKLPHVKANAPKGDVNVSADLEGPGFSGELEKRDLNLSSPDVEIKCPDLNGPNAVLKAPAVDIEAPSGKFKWLTLTKPKFGLSGPKMKGHEVDIDADLSAPDMNLSTLNIDGEISASDVDLSIPKAEVDLQAPDIDIEALSSKFKWPHLNKHKFGLHGPKVNSPGVDIEAEMSNPDLELNLPKADLSSPEVDVKAHVVDIHPPTGKLKFPTLKKPNFRLSGPNIKAPDIDVDADLKAPDLNIKGPEVDLNASEVDIEPVSGKLKWFTLKKTKFGLSGPKVKGLEELNLAPPNVDGEINAPDVDLILPKSDLEGPEVDVDTDAHSGKFKWFNLKKPTADLKADLQGSDLNLSAPAIEGNIAVPDINVSLPEANLKGPDVDLDLDAPSGKFKLPKLKWTKIRKVKGPELDVDLKTSELAVDVNSLEADLKGPCLNLKTTDLNLSAPAIEGDIAAPDFNTSLPEVDPDAPSGTFKLPKYKLPKFSVTGRRVKGPNLDAELKAPKLDVSVPDVDVSLPTADIQAPVVELKTPDLDLSAPKIEGTIAAPDLSVSLPEADIKGPEVDLDTPEVDLDVPSGTFKLPKFKLPKTSLTGPRVKGPNLDAELKAPKLDVSVPDVDLKTPDLNRSAPKLDGEVNVPEIRMNVPKTDLKGPGLVLKAPDVDIDAPSGKFKLPHFKLPTFGLSVPRVESRLEAPKVDIALPQAYLKLSDPNVKSDISAPDVNLSLPKTYLSGPEVELNGPDLSLSTPEMKVSVPDIKGPDAKFKAKDVDIEAPSENLPHFKMPKFGLSGPRIKGTEFNASADVNTPDVEVSVPKNEGEISTPELSLSAPGIEASADMPDLDVNVPEADLKVDVEEEGDTHKSTFKWPFKWPSFNLSGSKGKDSDMDDEEESKRDQVEVPMFTFHRLPQNNKIESAFQDAAKALGEAMDTPKLEGGLETAGVEVSLPKVNEGQKVTSPSGLINIMERLNRFKAKTPTANVSLPEVKGELHTPSLDVSSTSDVDSSTKLKRGTFKVTKPESGIGLEYPVVDSEGNDSMSISLSNMLGKVNKISKNM